ncbi:MAG TPA: MATE family efflux transporter, partial [Candidatus Fimivicinus intestinavium]|nr:MATE family efflux transporter [Candidatus Fimivicinus intestinavium]
GALPIMGYNYGARDRKRFLTTLRCAVLVAVGIMAAGNLLFFLLPDKLLLLFDASSGMLALGVPALRIISCSYLFAAVGLILSTLFQAAGRGGYSLTVFLLRQLLVVVPLAFLLSQWLGVNGIWISFPIAEAAGALAAGLFFLRFRRRDLIFRTVAGG